jgi:23S rRNA U2552 (ribose-2'-O)-methylase RlmE/FtsJ
MSYGHLLNDFLISIFEDHVDIQYSDIRPENYILNDSLRGYLITIKKEIDNVYDKWDKNKRLTNKYEYVNTVIHHEINNVLINTSICSYKPISRSYFKLIEILNLYKFDFPKAMYSFHLAEGPGGFIEAITNYRKNKNDKYFGMTLMKKNNDVPKWGKIQDFLRHNKNINIVYGPKRDGNLYLKHNLDYIMNTYYNKFDFITGDGGFDYSVDFNRQEENSINLIFCEVLYALILQKQNGSFVLKVFDCFHKQTTEILFLLTYFYNEVHFYKPHTSREANSEKYIVCKGFQNHQNRYSIINALANNFELMETKHITSIFNHDIHSLFLHKVEEINAIYGQQQIENILTTLNYIKENIISNNKEKVDKIKSMNIKKCIQWCKLNNQPIYAFLQTLCVD